MRRSPHAAPPEQPIFEQLEQRLMLSMTSVGIAELEGVTTTNYPVTLSMVFAEGDVADNVTAEIGGQALAT